MASQLEQRFTEMMYAFRKEFENVPKDVQSLIISAESMKNPCQIHILTCKEYQLNLIIKTHYPEFGDIVKEIYIHHDKFDDHIVNFLEQPIWKKLAEGDSVNGGDYNLLLGYLVRFGSKIRDYNFDRQSTVTSFTGDSSLSTWELFCDITDFDLNKKAKTFVDSAMSAFNESKKFLEIPIQNPPSQIQHSGFGAYFYPFILIGDFKPTFKGQLTGSDFSKFDEYVYDAKFSNMRLIVTKIGLVAIETDNPVQANKIVNTVFGTALLLGLQVYANRLNEIASVSLKETAFVHSWQTSTIRTMMYDYRARFARLNLLKIPIPVDTINEIIKTAERIWLEDKFIIELELFLQSRTHLDNSEFLQSFNTSWLIIEKYLRRKFHDKINSNSDGVKKHLGRLEISRIMDILKSDGDVTIDEFKKYDELREPRNRIFHGKDPPNLDEARKCLDVAMEIVRRETSIDKKFDFSTLDLVYL